MKGLKKKIPSEGIIVRTTTPTSLLVSPILKLFFCFLFLTPTIDQEGSCWDLSSSLVLQVDEGRFNPTIRSPKSSWKQAHERRQKWLCKNTHALFVFGFLCKFVDYAKKDVDLSIIEEKENIELVKEGGAKGEKISIYNIFHDKFHHCWVIKLLLFSNESIIDIILLSNIYNSQP